MRIFKSVMIISTAVFFVFACSQPKANTNSNTVAPNANGASTSTASPSNEIVTADLAAARKIYAEKCVACHKENGEGGKVNLDGAEFNVPSYKSDRSKNKTDERLLEKIVNGDDEMPAFKDKLSAEQMKSLVQMIRKDFQGK